jgi:hypothetical protein
MTIQPLERVAFGKTDIENVLAKMKAMSRSLLNRWW